jgi:uncharacterized protein YigA (DUF484 family)
MWAEADQAGQYGLAEEIRDRILSDPTLLLDDAEVMRALVAANDRAMGENIVDLRGLAMRQLEERLDRLEETHRSVIAAAYENLAGTNMVQRAVLQMLEPLTFDAFLLTLERQVKQTLRLEAIQLVLESRQGEGDERATLDPVVRVVEAGFADDYLTLGRDGPPRKVVLRATAPESARVFGTLTPQIRSEAVLRLDLGAGRLPGLLVLGAEDAQQFRPAQGSDLLTFLARSFELAMRRWLS